MEEVLSAELTEGLEPLRARARELLDQLLTEVADPGVAPDPHEAAATTLRTLQLPEIAAVRVRLVPEWPVYALFADAESPSAVIGRIDAIVYEDGQPELIIDWKSDINPNESDVRDHIGQIEEYVRVTRASRGALVYMTTGQIHWVSGNTEAA